MKLRKDRQLGIICLLLAAFIVYETSQIKIRREEFAIIGPRTFPLIAAGLFAICGVYFLVHKLEAEDKKYMTLGQFKRAMMMFGCYVIYLAGLYFLGLKFAAPIAIFAMTMLFCKGKIAWWKALLYGVIFGAVFYGCYVYLFQIRVPMGILGI